ncbi:MAG: hypothetical protein HC850_11525 [Rhodomicrobium sp.]|nr:hypothetical protein [Rhodomicrobium sp.]
MPASPHPSFRWVDPEAGAAALPFKSASALSAETPLTLASYYGGYSSQHNDEEYEEDDGDYGYKRRHYNCGSYVRYKKKYVCEHTEPRCFKQRECIWHYGREYCRYVKKCVGGEKYCKWISVPVKSCRCGNCW